MNARKWLRHVTAIALFCFYYLPNLYFGFKATRSWQRPLFVTLTSGVCWSPWLIPHNVLLNAQNAGSADKRTWPWSNNGVQCTITRSNMAVRITLQHEPGFEPGFLRTEIVWHTSQSPAHITHNRIAILIGAWGLAVQWRLDVGYGPMRNHIFPT